MSDLRNTSLFWYGKSEIEIAALSGQQICRCTDAVDAWEMAFEVAALETPGFWDAERAKFRAKHKREMEFADVARIYWGGGAMGVSQDTGKRNRYSRSSDDGIVNQT